jgi:hypothetical protein
MTSTYPPSPTTSTTVPPPSSTALTGPGSDVPMFVGSVLVLAVCGAIVLRVASRRAKAVTR